MLPISDAVLDTLKDYRDAHGWTDLQLARHIGVNHGTLSRWLSGGIASMRKTVFERVIGRLGIDATSFESGVVVDQEFRARLSEGLRARGISGSVQWTESGEGQCGVPFNRVVEWLGGASQSMRYDIYLRLCELLGWNTDFRPPVPLAQLPPVENPAAMDKQTVVHRSEEPYDAWDDPAKKDPQVPQFPASHLTRVWVMGQDEYEKLAAGMSTVRLEGKVRLYTTEDGKGPIHIAVVSGGTQVADGEKIAVRDGKQLVLGHLRLMPILVRGDTFYDLLGPEEAEEAGDEGNG